MLGRYGIPAGRAAALALANLVLTAIFTLELLVKLAVCGVRKHIFIVPTNASKYWCLITFE